MKITPLTPQKTSVVVTTPHFLVIAALMIILTVSYYGDHLNLSWAPFINDLLSNDYVHDIHRALFLLPMVYAALIFRFKGALVITLLTCVILIPRGLFISPHPDPLLRALVFALVAGLATISLGIAQERGQHLSDEVTEHRQAEERVNHLNAVLRAIRNVNRIVFHESDRERLLQRSCESLIETRGYYRAWIALLDELYNPVMTATADTEDGFGSMASQFKQGKLPECMQRALSQKNLVIIDHPQSACIGCPLMPKHSDRGAMIVRLEHGEKVYGSVCVYAPADLVADKEEQELFHELAGDLAFALHDMELEEEHKRDEDEIRRLYSELEQRVAERTAELAAVNKELESFNYSVSHDLRAPLRGIDGFSQALLEDYADKLDEQGKDYLQRVRTASQRMGNLIDDLLSLSRVSRSEICVKTINLSQMAQNIAAELHQREPERQVAFVIEEGLMTNGDEHLLQVALQNLLDNAWKFSSRHPNAKIEFGKVEYEGKPAFFVRDDGAGFDMNYGHKLFGAFQRLHSVTEFGGTGIGLATVQRIIHRHGGYVWAEGSVEQGATFYFTT